ncbi:MAG: universal stress protein [Deltaproteobacteria bacterium]|nr:universal stress protein [Deltaproteobacteria bacterium]
MFKNILVPTDLSKFSVRAVQPALDMVQRYKGMLHLLYVYEPVYELPSLKELVTHEFKDKMRIVAEDGLGEFVSLYLPKGAKVHQMVIPGNISDVVVDVGERMEMNLIVMAAHNRKGIERYFISSTTERVIRNSHCSVMVIRPPEGQEE